MDSPSRVLIVDDDPLVRRMLLAALGENGWEVEAVESAEEGLSRFRAKTWSVLVVDKNLPGMSGVELIRTVREEDEAVGVLLITGYQAASTALDILHLRLDGYLEKPFEDIFAVTRTVEEAIAKQAERRLVPGLSGALSHFRRAAAHLQALAGDGKEDGKLRVVVASPSSADADWIAARLDPENDVSVRVATHNDLLALMQQKTLDVAFLDLALAGGDPVRWLTELKKITPRLACIVISGRPPLSVVTQFIALDVRAVLEKPFQMELFERRVAGVLGRLRRVRREEAGLG